MKDGYYWLKVDRITSWEIAYKKDGVWYLNGDGFIPDEYINDVVDEIGDYIETPDKYK